MANAGGRVIIDSVPDLVPSSFSALVRGREPEPYLGGDSWLARLPGLMDDSLADWDLTLDGDPMHGVCALVLPVRRRDDSTAVLKATWPHPEARHEHLALQHWGGVGAVRLLAANPNRWTMLLERLNSDLDLGEVPIDEACTVIGALLRQLDHDPLPQLSRLSGEATALAARLRSSPRALPRRFAQQAGALLSDLMTDAAVDSRLVDTDLHYRNVLAADRQPWLAIDPKPLAADPAFAVTPALWNRWPEAVASGNLRRHLRRRLSVICESAGLDEDRARAWSIVREVQMGLAAIAGDDHRELTKAIAIITALQPG